MIKDFLNRKEISREAKRLVSDCFSEAEKRKLTNLSKDKALKKVEALTRKLKVMARDFKHEKNLGLYGTAKLAKEIQSALESEKVEEKIISFIVNSLVRG